MMRLTAAIFAGVLFLILAIAQAETSPSPSPNPSSSPTPSAKALAAEKAAERLEKADKKQAKKEAAAKAAKKPIAYDVKAMTSEDTTAGKGKAATKGKTIKVNYTGWIYDPSKPKNRGAQFDTSVDKEPFTFTLGAGSVIKGWDEGFSDMKVGGKRVLTIPSEMGYGTRGAGDVILPNQALVFEVELLDVMEMAPAAK